MLERSSKRYSNRVRQSKIDIDSSQFTDKHNYRIFVATWNVGGKSPPSYLNLEDWLYTSHHTDIYVLGKKASSLFHRQSFQSLSHSMRIDNDMAKPQSNLGHRFNVYDHVTFGHRSRNTQYSQYSLMSYGGSFAIKETNRQLRHSSYCLVAKKQVAGIFLTIWVKSDLRDDVHNIKVPRVSKGLMGYLGNKGSIPIGMSLHHTSFCFVFSHLTSAEKKGDEL
ncbi:hypothetical protein PTKIN_Ptkin12aG0190500 [Pterospermum kingtungense]